MKIGVRIISLPPSWLMTNSEFEKLTATVTAFEPDEVVYTWSRSLRTARMLSLKRLGWKQVSHVGALLSEMDMIVVSSPRELWNGRMTDWRGLMASKGTGVIFLVREETT